MDKKEILHRPSIKEQECPDKVTPFVIANKEKRSLQINRKRIHSVSSSLEKWADLPLTKAKVDMRVAQLDLIPTLMKKIESKMDESYSWELLSEILYHNEEHWEEMVAHNLFHILVSSNDPSTVQNQMWCLSLFPENALATHIKPVLAFLKSVDISTDLGTNQSVMYMIRCLHKINGVDTAVSLLFQILMSEIDHEVLKECLDAILMVPSPLLKRDYKSFELIAAYVEDEPTLVLPILTMMMTNDIMTLVLNDSELLDYLFCAYRFFPLLCLEFSGSILEHCSSQEQLDFFIKDTEFLVKLHKAGRSKEEEVLKLVKTLKEYVEKIGYDI